MKRGQPQHPSCVLLGLIIAQYVLITQHSSYAVKWLLITAGTISHDGGRWRESVLNWDLGINQIKKRLLRQKGESCITLQFHNFIALCLKKHMQQEKS